MSLFMHMCMCVCVAMHAAYCAGGKFTYPLVIEKRSGPRLTCIIIQVIGALISRVPGLVASCLLE